MSNALAISGVTAVLQYYLMQVYGSVSAIGGVTVSAQAPDLVAASQSATNPPPLQVNLFLHQVTHNPAWRNAALPSLSADGATRLKGPLLALDLHYLLTVYASEDTQAEALLGYAVMMLHENAILPRAEIRTALGNVPLKNPLYQALTTTGLAEQIEAIKITPSPLGREETAWLWTALRSDYRPTYSFQVSVVLIESPIPTSFALPVLSRSIAAQGGPLAGLTAGLPAHLLAVQPPPSETASTPGDTVTVSGQSLSGASLVALMNPRLGIWYPPFAPATVTGTSVTFVIPDNPSTPLPAGFYNLWLILQDSKGAVVGTTNILPFSIAPKIVAISAGATSPKDGTTVMVTCDPAVQSNQTVSLSLAGTAVPAQPPPAPATTTTTATITATTNLTFQFPAPPLAGGSYPAQLRVDGVDSPLSLPPAFAGPVLNI